MRIGDNVSIRGDQTTNYRIISFDGVKAQLVGVDFRLIVERSLSELGPPMALRAAFDLPLSKTNNGDLKYGTILHLDGDEFYLKKALQVYKHYGIMATGYFIEENSLAGLIQDLIKKHRPDILVVTGHDALKVGREERIFEEDSYRFSSAFAEAVRKAREIEPSLDQLVIISGACQSYYELLIQAGSNFASSPTRSNIHLLDPVIIASEIATSLTRNYLEIEKIIDHTVTKKLGGLDTRGKARKIYLGG